MSEEQKGPSLEGLWGNHEDRVPPEDKPLVVGKPPMEYFFRLTTVDDRTFVGECKKIAKGPGLTSISAQIAVVLMGGLKKANDPYVLDNKSRKKGAGFNMQDRGPREPKTDKSVAKSQAPQARAEKKAAQ
jgi:hypothetical protein